MILLMVLVLGGTAAVTIHQRRSDPAPETNALSDATAETETPEAQELYPTLYSPLDADGDGIDDYHDILRGARDYIASKPVYNECGYYLGGYPDDGTGVCTDVIWSAFQSAGYDLKALVDADIEAHPEWYSSVDWPEPDIDFRRVANLDDFFSRHAVSLTCSLAQPEAWQAGDIVVFGDREHIAICSDHRRIDCIPWIIHHGSLEEGAVEVNAMNRHPVTAHYRWCPTDPAVPEPLPVTAEEPAPRRETAKNFD